MNKRIEDTFILENLQYLKAPLQVTQAQDAKLRIQQPFSVLEAHMGDCFLRRFPLLRQKSNKKEGLTSINLHAQEGSRAMSIAGHFYTADYT